MRAIDSRIRKNTSNVYFVKNTLDHKELDIICEALAEKIHKGIADEDTAKRTRALYSELFTFWEATTLDNSGSVPPELVKIDEIDKGRCPAHTTWIEQIQDCVPDAGYYKDRETGEIKPVPVRDCGNNAHFDPVRGCVCNEGFQRDRSGNCVPIPTEPEERIDPSL